MNILLGSVAPMETIKGWIETIDAEFGLSAQNEACLRHFAAMKDYYIFIFEPDWYAVLEPAADLHGNREMYVVSYYIKPESRDFRLFLTIQRKIEQIAKAWDCRFLIQGSHLGDRLFKYLEHSGYKVATMKKELL